MATPSTFGSAMYPPAIGNPAGPPRATPPHTAAFKLARSSCLRPSRLPRDASSSSSLSCSQLRDQPLHTPAPPTSASRPHHTCCRSRYICRAWATVSNPSIGSPPTRCVGLSGVTSSGCAASSSLSCVQQLVVLPIRDRRLRFNVVPPIVLANLLTQARRFAFSMDIGLDFTRSIASTGNLHTARQLRGRSRVAAISAVG